MEKLKVNKFVKSINAYVLFEIKYITDKINRPL